MCCRKCIFPKNCENFEESRCKDCEKYVDAVPCGKPVLPEYACFKCKYEKTCLVCDKKEKG